MVQWIMFFSIINQLGDFIYMYVDIIVTNHRAYCRVLCHIENVCNDLKHQITTQGQLWFYQNLGVKRTLYGFCSKIRSD